MLAEEMFYVSGEIPRVSGFERGYPGQHRLNEAGQWEPDELLMDERFVALHIAGKGQFILTACSHAGLVNVLTAARARFPEIPIYGVMGGFHLSGSTEAIIPQTVAAIAPFDLNSSPPDTAPAGARSVPSPRRMETRWSQPRWASASSFEIAWTAPSVGPLGGSFDVGRRATGLSRNSGSSRWTGGRVRAWGALGGGGGYVPEGFSLFVEWDFGSWNETSMRRWWVGSQKCLAGESG